MTIPKDFAADWEAGWNSHDLDRILAHYREDIRFRSLKALALVESGQIEGRDALRAYWTKALARQPDLQFNVLEVFEGSEMLVIRYQNQSGVIAAETLYFDDHGKVWQAAACHRAV